MHRIDRYIFRQIALSTFFIAIGLTLVIWLTQSLRFIEYIVVRGLPLIDFIALVGLMIPAFLMLILPLALFFAVLFVYGKLYSDSELVICHGAGISRLGIGRAALVLAGMISVICYGLSLWLMPLSYNHFKNWQYHIRYDYSAIILQEGVFNEVMDGVTVYVRARGPNGELLSPMIHDHRNPKRPVTVLAASGALVIGKNGRPSLIMSNGNRQEVARDTGELSMLYFDQWRIKLHDDRESIMSNTRYRTAAERFLPDLLWPQESDDVLSQHSSTLRAEGHHRLTAPFYPIVFVLIAMIGLTYGSFSRRRQVIRFIFTGLAALAVQGLGITLHNLAAKHALAIILMYLNILLPTGLCLYVLMKDRFPWQRQRHSAFSNLATP